MKTQYKYAFFASALAAALLVYGCGGSGSSGTSAAPSPAIAGSSNPTPASLTPQSESVNPSTSWKSFAVYTINLNPFCLNNRGDMVGLSPTTGRETFISNSGTVVTLQDSFIGSNYIYFAGSYLNDADQIISQSHNGLHTIYYSSPTAAPVQVPDVPGTDLTFPEWIDGQGNILACGVSNSTTVSATSNWAYYSSHTATPQLINVPNYTPLQLDNSGLTCGWQGSGQSAQRYEYNVSTNSGKAIAPGLGNISMSDSGFIATGTLINSQTGVTLVHPDGTVSNLRTGETFAHGVSVNDNAAILCGAGVYKYAKGYTPFLSFLPSNTPWSEFAPHYINNNGVVLGIARYNGKQVYFRMQLPTGYY